MYACIHVRMRIYMTCTACIHMACTACRCICICRSRRCICTACRCICAACRCMCICRSRRCIGQGLARCMRTCVYTCTHVRMNACIHTYVHACIHTYRPWQSEPPSWWSTCSPASSIPQARVQNHTYLLTSYLLTYLLDLLTLPASSIPQGRAQSQIAP